MTCPGPHVAYSGLLWIGGRVCKNPECNPVMARKNANASATELAPAKVEVDLFPSYEAALASSTELSPWAVQVLGVAQIDGPEGEKWAGRCGVEVQRRLKAEEAALKTALAPVAQIEATIRGYHKDTIAQLKACKAHLAALVDRSQAAAAAAQAHALTHVTSPEERDAALALLAPKPEGYVQRELWSWAIADGGLPTAEVRPDGTVALVFSRSSIPPDYFVLDGARLDREVRESKAATNIPGIVASRDVKGHFRK